MSEPIRSTASRPSHTSHRPKPAPESGSLSLESPLRIDAGQGAPGHGLDAGAAAVRLISEVTHDLRSPLASVTQTLRSLRAGDFGGLGDDQASVLAAALQQCDYLESLIDQSMRADGLIRGTFEMHRQATTRLTIERLVTQATAAVLATKQIELLWDGGDQAATSLFVDQNCLSRLLVNLITNAARASSQGSTILVRVDDETERDVVTWSVIDSGRGFTPLQLSRLSAAPTDSRGGIETPTMRSSGDSPHLGLMISRQLATWLHSPLTIRSQVGRGSEVSFTTPMFTPACVATAFARFRASLMVAPVRPRTSDATLGAAADVRDRDSQAESARRPHAHVARLGWTGNGPRRIDRAAIGHLAIAATASGDQADAVDRSLQSTLSPFELTFRTGRRDWAWCLDADHHILQERCDRITRQVADEVSGVALQWSESVVVPVHQRSFQSLLIDRLTMGTLAGASGRVANQDDVRLGTAPLATSTIAASRLDEELRRLSARMREQSTRLQRNAAALRP